MEASVLPFPPPTPRKFSSSSQTPPPLSASPLFQSLPLPSPTLALPRPKSSPISRLIPLPLVISPVSNSPSSLQPHSPFVFPRRRTTKKRTRSSSRKKKKFFASSSSSINTHSQIFKREVVVRDSFVFLWSEFTRGQQLKLLKLFTLYSYSSSFY